MDDTYMVSIAAEETLEQIELMLLREEATWGELLGMSIGYNAGKVCTIVTFKDHIKQAAWVPKPVLSLARSEPGKQAPAGTVEVWSGLILVESAATYVAAYR